MACNRSIGTETFFRWLFTHGWIGKWDSGIPISGLGDDSGPEDVVAWALMADALYGAGLDLANPCVVQDLYARWAAEHNVRGVSS